MSKKSRRRNKKLLAMLALAGGAAMMGRGKGTAQGVSGSDKAKFTSDAAYSPAPKVVTGTEYPGANKAVGPLRTDIYRGSGKKLSDTGQIIGAGGLQGGKSRGVLAQIMQAKANAPKGINHPLHNPTRIRTQVRAVNQPGSAIIKPYKSGGRVTGIAKRGFGRALMKGKK